MNPLQKDNELLANIKLHLSELEALLKEMNLKRFIRPGQAERNSRWNTTKIGRHIRESSSKPFSRQGLFFIELRLLCGDYIATNPEQKTSK